MSAPLLYIQEKYGADGEVTCQGQTSLEAEPGPGPPPSAQHVPSCQPASSSGPGLRPAGEDVDQILCPLTVFALPPTGPPAPPLAPPVSGSWNLSPLNRGQWSPDSPSHLGALGPPALQSLYPQQGLSLCQERKRRLPSCTLRSWDVSTLASAQTTDTSAVVFTDGPGSGLSPNTRIHILSGEVGEEGVGRAARGQEHLLRVYSEPGALHGGLYAQQSLGQLQSRLFSVASTKRGFRQSCLSFLHSRPVPPFPCGQ